MVALVRKDPSPRGSACGQSFDPTLVPQDQIRNTMELVSATESDNGGRLSTATGVARYYEVEHCSSI